MATVTQTVTATPTYTPFEGMSDAHRLLNHVPRGMIRFTAAEALDAKPVNDLINLSVFSSLPQGYAYIFSSISFEIACDTAAEWNSTARVRIFNGQPNAPTAPNEQPALVTMTNYNDGGTSDSRRILDLAQGSLRNWWPSPIYNARFAISIILQFTNFNVNVQAAGDLIFNMQLYQYDLNQAVRQPLNSPLPVGIR